MPYTLNYRPQHQARINAKLAQLRGDGVGRLTRAIEVAIVEGNRDDRLRGVDRRGVPLTALKTERKGKYKGATGPPLAPFGVRSRSIELFFARAVRDSSKAENWTLRAGFEGTFQRGNAVILGFHATGSHPNPVRDVFGLSPKTWAKVRGLFRDFAQGVFKAK